MDVQTTMTRTVILIGPEDKLDKAHEIMTLYKFRHLPVVEEGRLLGMLSNRDVLRWSRQEEDNLIVPEMLVCDAMCKGVVTCSSKTSVANVARLMIELQIDAFPIMDNDNELVGLVTSSDLLELLARSDDDLSNKILPFTYELNTPDQMAAMPN